MSAPFDPTAVRCPTCHAQTGEPCTDSDQLYRDPHWVRVATARSWAEHREAARAVREARERVDRARERARAAWNDVVAAEQELTLALSAAERFRSAVPI